MRVEALLHVNVEVTDLERALGFYRALGLTEIVRRGTPGRAGAWFQLPNACELHLSIGPAKPASRVHFAIRVDDLEAARRALQDRGATLETERDIPGLIRFFTRDPDGNRIEVVQPLAPATADRDAGANGLAIRPYSPADEAAVVALWNECGLVVQWNDPQQDIARKQRVQADLFLVAVEAGRVIASVMAGYEGHRGWINYLAVSPAVQRRGIGRALMARAEADLRRLGCPKINLQVRSSNRGVIEFYQRLGFTVDDVVGMGKRLMEDRNS